MILSIHPRRRPRKASIQDLGRGLAQKTSLGFALLAVAPIHAQEAPKAPPTAAQAPLVEPLPVVEAKTLTRVPGPLAPNEPDPARTFPTDHRDIDLAIRASARRMATLPCLEMPKGPVEIHDKIADVAGWKAYRLEVEPGKHVHVALVSQHNPWFLMRAVNRWGDLREGMLKNIIYTGKPEAFYHNPKETPQTVYFIVDTQERSAIHEPFALRVTYPEK